MSRDYGVFSCTENDPLPEESLCAASLCQSCGDPGFTQAWRLEDGGGWEYYITCSCPCGQHQGYDAVEQAMFLSMRLAPAIAKVAG